MRPMTLAESGHSSGGVSLAALFEGTARVAADSGLDIHTLAERIVIAGWPTLVDGTPDQAMTALRGYLADVSRVDLRRLDGVQRDPVNIERVVRSLARNVCTAASAPRARRPSGITAPWSSRCSPTRRTSRG